MFYRFKKIQKEEPNYKDFHREWLKLHILRLGECKVYENGFGCLGAVSALPRLTGWRYSSQKARVLIHLGCT